MKPQDKKYTNMFLNQLRNFMRDESGQTTTEYVLLLAVVVFIVMRVKSTMQESLTRLVSSAFNRAETELNNSQ